MLMDLTCPAEFSGVEVLRDSGGRAQAYLTFLNLSDETLTELYAMVTMLDGEGVSMGIRPLRYRRLTAVPHAQFTLCMVMDDLPFFQDARVTIQRLRFESSEGWEWDEDKLMDCTPRVLAPGPQRVALVAIAGPDAICWPERRREVWVCVCGRFNMRTWKACKRCRRDREDTFARYELNAVMAQYQQRRNQEIIAERAAHQQAIEMQQVTRTRRHEEFERRLALEKNRRRALWMALVALMLLLWGAWSLAREHAARNAENPRIVAQMPTEPPVIP